MSAHEILVKELQHQPDAIAGKLLDYLHTLTSAASFKAPADQQQGDYFATYWSRFYGAFEGEEWEEPPDFPAEKREDW